MSIHMVDRSLIGLFSQHPLFWSGLAVAGIVTLTYLLADRTLSAPRYRGAATDHFDGIRFHNLQLPPRKGLLAFLRWQLTSRPGYWSKWTAAQTSKPSALRVAGPDLRVTFINHATVLIQLDGVNILTDPIWSDRASPIGWVGPKRRNPPGLQFEHLPPIDLVLVSHNHYDHCDTRTLKRLCTEHRPRFIVGLGNRALLERLGIDGVAELDWWQGLEIHPGVRISCVPARHFSGRGFSDTDTTLWCGFVVEGSSGNVYFAGDTGLGPHFQKIRDRFGPMRLALLPIGAYLPAWFMKPMHLSPAEAVAAHHVLDAEVSMAIHFGTFPLGDDGECEPVLELREALLRKGQGLSPFWVLDRGEAQNVPPMRGRRQEQTAEAVRR